MTFADHSFARKGLPHMSGHALNILLRLREEMEAGGLFVVLDLHKRTARALVRKDLVFESVDLYGGPTAYKILPRGLEVLAAYEQPIRHFDGLCPGCRKSPKMHSSGYCVACSRIKARAWRLKRVQRQPSDRPCRKCKRNPRRISKFGYQYDLCSECEHERSAARYRWKQAQLWERAKRGEQVMCADCQEREVARTDKYISEYCNVCNARRARNYMRGQSWLRRNQARHGSDAAD